MFKFLRRLFLKAPRHRWRAIRAHGGGAVTSPEDMNEKEATIWVAYIMNGEILYIDPECGFIFYRPKE